MRGINKLLHFSIKPSTCITVFLSLSENKNNMSRVAVKKEVLQWAIERCGKSPEDMQERFPRILKWISGEIKPTFRQLEKLARATLTPLGFLFLDKPPEEPMPIPYFRTLSGKTQEKPSPELLTTIRTMQYRQSWMSEYLKDEGEEPLDFVNSARPGEQVESVAQRMRKTLSFHEKWASHFNTWEDALRALREAMENIGIIVVANGVVGNNTHRKLNVEEFRGFVLVDDYAPLVFVNNDDWKAAQMFTLAHELAHIFFGSSAAFDLRNMQPAEDPKEQACNRAAAEFLLPKSRLFQIWASVKNKPKPFNEISRQFKVSTIVAARRALDLGLIQKKEFFDFYKDYKSDKFHAKSSDSGGGDFYNNQNLRVGRLFASTVINAVREGKLLYSDAYKLTGLYGNTFDKYAEHIGMGGL